MKNILLSFPLVLLMIFVLSQQTQAQQTSAVSKSKYLDAGSWTAAKIKNDSSVISGVAFYKKTSGEMIVLKIVNMNAYSVKVEWEEIDGAKKEIIIAANSTIEGNADNTKKNTDEGNLVFSKQMTEKAKEQMQMTIRVTQVK